MVRLECCVITPSIDTVRGWVSERERESQGERDRETERHRQEIKRERERQNRVIPPRTERELVSR